MPGDGITDVVPIAQNQEKGRSAAPLYRRRMEEYTYFDGWIEMLWEWWGGIQDASNYPYRTRGGRQRDPRIPQVEVRNEWLLVLTVADVATQLPAVQEHAGRSWTRRQSPGLPRQYRPTVVPCEETVDPTLVSNIAAWLPAVNTHLAAEPWRQTNARVSFAQRFASVLLYTAFTPHFEVVTELLGNVHYTGGGLVLP